MKKNKLIKILASISTIGAIGIGTIVSISSCGSKPEQDKILTIGAATSSYLVTFNAGEIVGLPTEIVQGKNVDLLSIYMIENGYQVLAFDNTVLSIANGAFESCKILSDQSFDVSIKLSITLSLIGDYAFRNCAGITRIDVPPNMTITSLGTDAFHGCKKLTGFGANVSTTTISLIGTDAFHGCPSLTTTGINFYAIHDCNQTVTSTGAY
jgi:hypothetical protein